jgi:hypothetical protein
MEEYYFSVENTNFMPNDYRTEGSYSKYSSIDDKFDWLNHYTLHIKYGLGRATYDSAQEVRNGEISREEGVALIKRFDGELPKIYLNDCLEYMGLSEERFNEIIEAHRTPHLWSKESGTWKLTKPIWDEDNDG